MKLTEPKQLTENHIILINGYARKAELDEQMCVDWVIGGKVTINEISQGILGTKIDD